MAQVMIPTPLRTFTRGQKTVTVAGTTVDEAIASLTRTYPDLKHHLFNDEGKLRNFVNVYLGEEDVRYLQQGATEIRDTDTLNIVPSVAGGTIGAPALVLKAAKVLDGRAPCPSSVLPTPSNRSSSYILWKGGEPYDSNRPIASNSFAASPAKSGNWDCISPPIKFGYQKLR